MSSKTIKVNYLARVEGEGAMYVKIRDRQVEDVQLRIFEPPRFFEAFLQGREYHEAPDITARICGICPIAYMLGAIQAMENCFQVQVPQGIRDLRRLIYCGEWMESHSLHIFMLHAPDFLGLDSAIAMAKQSPELLQRGLRLKKLGNQILEVIGGRAVHPVNLRVGGFYKLPSRQALESLRSELEWAIDAATATVRWTATLPFPEFTQDYEFIALQHSQEYAITEGRLVSNQGLDIAIHEFYDYIAESHEPQSTALHSVLKSRGNYLVGPLARFNLNYDQLTPQAKALAAAVGLSGPCRNPFKSIIVRSIEILCAAETALQILDRYIPPPNAVVDYTVKAGTGHGCTEAPRGICYHRYEVDDQGIIQSARIAPPTAQNQPTIEQDLRRYVTAHVDLETDQLRPQCELIIRNYDPCISCSTHFLRLDIDRA